MTSRKHNSRPNPLALSAETGTRAGRGKDNLVHNLILPPHAEAMAQSGDWVVKVSHKALGGEEKRDWSVPAAEAAISGTLYKRNKYDILKHFLGNNIPDSMFLVSTVEDQGRVRPAEITLQQKVPNVTIDKLNAQQKNNPVLHTKMLQLLTKLQYMYSVVGEANARTSQAATLDTKLDLGQVSSFVRGESLDHQFDVKDARRALSKISSPNLLVDPETFDLFCIDFDQGDWEPGMQEAKELVFSIDEHRLKRATTAAHLALQGHVERPY